MTEPAESVVGMPQDAVEALAEAISAAEQARALTLRSEFAEFVVDETGHAFIAAVLAVLKSNGWSLSRLAVAPDDERHNAIADVVYLAREWGRATLPVVCPFCGRTAFDGGHRNNCLITRTRGALARFDDSEPKPASPAVEGE